MSEREIKKEREEEIEYMWKREREIVKEIETEFLVCKNEKENWKIKLFFIIDAQQLLIMLNVILRF